MEIRTGYVYKIVKHGFVIIQPIDLCLHQSLHFLVPLQCTITLKMEDQGRSDFYVVFTMNLCAL